MRKLAIVLFVLLLASFASAQSPRTKTAEFVVQASASSDTLFTIAATGDTSSKAYRCWPDMSIFLNVFAPDDSTVSLVFDFLVAPKRPGEGRDDVTQFTSVFRDTISTEGTKVEVIRIDGAVTPDPGASVVIPAGSVPGPPWFWKVTLDGQTGNAADSVRTSMVFQGAHPGFEQ